jgi:hypothetical protein
VTTTERSTPLNLCTACGEDFASLRAFDQHILSKPVEPTFDCKQTSQLLAEGWTRDTRGRWTSPELAESAERLREKFGKVA